jgi:hypothetical protein
MKIFQKFHVFGALFLKISESFMKNFSEKTARNIQAQCKGVVVNLFAHHVPQHPRRRPHQKPKKCSPQMVPGRKIP